MKKTEFVQSNGGGLAVVEVEMVGKFKCVCGKTNEVDLDISHSGGYYQGDSNGAVDMKCPHCGAEFETDIY